MNANVKTREEGEAKRPRGRPRSERAKAEILAAARELLAELGPSGVTIEGVAARAGVGKPTIYRWWPDRHAVVMAALMESESPPQAPPRRASSPLRSLRAQLRRMAAVFATGTGRAVAAMLAAAEQETEISRAFRNHFVLARREEGRALLREAIAAREIRADIDIEVALDMIYGPLFFRLLLGHAPLDERFMERVLDHALRGLKHR